MEALPCDAAPPPDIAADVAVAVDDDGKAVAPEPAASSDMVLDPDPEPEVSLNMVDTMLIEDVLALALNSFSSPSITVTGTLEMMALGRSIVLRRLFAFNSSRVEVLEPLLPPAAALLLLLLPHCDMCNWEKSPSATDFGRSTAKPDPDENPLALKLCPDPLVPLWNPPIIKGDQDLSIRPSVTDARC